MAICGVILGGWPFVVLPLVGTVGVDVGGHLGGVIFGGRCGGKYGLVLSWIRIM